MGDIAIRVSGLGKQYQIGAAQKQYSTLRDALSGAAAGLARSLRGQGGRAARDTIWALKDVSFEVKRGEVLGIIGRNGAGKSTLLKILARITEPTCGEVDIYGRVGSLLEVGTGFHPELTGRENIYLNGAVLGMHRREIHSKFDAIVDFSGIEKFIDTPVKHYSSGMYMRLAFAVAAHLEPEILLVDEVLAVGDAEFQKKCLGKMGEVAGEGRTVLFVSHNLAHIQRLCSRTLLLASGGLAAIAETNVVVGKYLVPATDTSLSWSRSEPPISDAYFTRVQLVNHLGEPVSLATTNSMLSVVLDFVIKTSIRKLQISIGLLDGFAGPVIFASSSQDSGVPPPENPGSFQAIVTIPKELFMPRQYGIRAVLWVPDTGTIDYNETIHFTAQETASLSNSTPGGRLGIITLRCDWTVRVNTPTCSDSR